MTQIYWPFENTVNEIHRVATNIEDIIKNLDSDKELQEAYKKHGIKSNIKPNIPPGIKPEIPSPVTKQVVYNKISFYQGININQIVNIYPVHEYVGMPDEESTKTHITLINGKVILVNGNVLKVIKEIENLSEGKPKGG